MAALNTWIGDNQKQEILRGTLRGASLGKLVWLGCGFFGALSMSSSADSNIDRPNVLMICIDDLNDWVGCLGGHPDVKTPHIDRLAEWGRNFSNAHCVVPVCSASRVSIMSGLHATTHGSYELGPAYHQIERLKDAPSMQAYFKEHGYRTIAGGKVLHHGFIGGLEKVIDVQLQGLGGPRPATQMNWPGGAWDWGAYPATDDQMGDYQLAKNAAGELQKEHDQPFFMSIGLYRPHVPMFVPQKWFDLYDRDTITLPKAPLSDMEDVPSNFQRKMFMEPTHAEVLQHGDWRGMTHAYLACVSFADMCVGTILDGLQNGPNRENTIVVLWSDHGFHLGEKQHWAKRTLWEESTRVPLMVAGPGIEGGVACSEAVSLLDIYPTLLELCGLPQTTQLDGVSLVPQIKDPLALRSEPVISSGYYGNYAIRTKDWRYIRYVDGAEELYDHRRDPDEFENLASSPEYRSIKRNLSESIPKRAVKEVKPEGKRECDRWE